MVSSDPNDNVDPLASFLIVTTQSVHVVFQHKSPELIALRFGCNQKLEQMIDVCVALRVNNLKPICNFLCKYMHNDQTVVHLQRAVKNLSGN